MPSDLRRLIRFVLPLIAIGILVGGLWPSTPAPTAEERVEHLASRIRCPFCNGESLAEATSQVARDYRLVIADMVAAGDSDQDIYDAFTARFGENLVLDPPASRWLLWAIPTVVLSAGGLLIVRRRRGRGGGAAASVGAPESLEAALSAVARDLDDLESQLAADELTETDEAGLRAIYLAEADRLEAALAAARPNPTDGPDRRRVLLGAAILVAGAFAITLAVVNAAGDNTAEGVVAAPPIDFDNITIEQLEGVVADNPDIVPMRSALAGMLFDVGRYDEAFDHYWIVLQTDPDSQPLARVGWIVYLLEGESELAAGYVEEALERRPDNLEAMWFLGNIRLHGLGDGPGAVQSFEALLGADLTQEERVAVTELLTAARELAT